MIIETRNNKPSDTKITCYIKTWKASHDSKHKNKHQKIDGKPKDNEESKGPEFAP